MARRGAPPQKKASWATLDTVQDTGSTTGESRERRKETSEKLDPPFRVEKESLIDADLLARFLKVGAAVAGFFITVVLPVVWYASKLDSRVDTLKVDVTEIKQRTEELVKNSVQHDGRLDLLEKTVNNNSAAGRPPGAHQTDDRQESSGI